jgi:hypothetical protein
MKASKIILSSAYLGPVQWYAAFLNNDATIEQHEHYVKQTWRNRMRIAGPNGVQDLIIPVHARNHTPLHEVTINYTEAWQRQHWQSIRSAYGNSPFFEFYADHFSPFYERKHCEKLLDYNTELLALTLRLLKQKKEIVFTNEFIPSPENTTDLRSHISPKENATFIPKRYLQVFEERHGFIPNLSIIDLLCCVGPASVEILNAEF